jgi:hypothetical protein
MRKLAWVASLAAAIVVAAAVIAVASGPSVDSPVTIHVIEHANTDKVIDTGAPGDTSGDLLTFHNPLFNKANTEVVGRDQGECTRISVKAGTWECRWIAFVEGGAITVEGPFYDTHDSVLAITGGRGVYRNARGTMELKARAGGTQFDFIYNVIP